jgi:mono/diheme cytochrome c family protein
MKTLLIFLALICLLVSCESTNYAPPPVTSQMAIVGARQHVRQGTNPSDWRIDLVTLRKGRALFASRCIECHTLPAVAQHSAAQWPGLIDEMADRANLKPAERKAVLAYILAARQM